MPDSDSDGPRTAQAKIASLEVLFCLTVFFSAWLLFQVQPIISKAILPWFGGTPAVWTTAMFFFQVALLIGYCYSHLTTHYLSHSIQKWLHILFCLSTLLFLPLSVDESLRPIGTVSNPSFAVFFLLLGSVGLPFLLLSTTAPLIQVWWHRSIGTAPYKLYAVSNTGSLLALLSYPFVIEPLIGTKWQMKVWSIIFFVVAACIGGCGYLAKDLARVKADANDATRTDKTSVKSVLAWLALSTCGSVLLLAMTNHITQNVAVNPFLWVAPLSIYLVSFILSFADRNFYRRNLFGGLMGVSYIATAFAYNFGVFNNLTLILTIHLVALFAGCMVCHGELARLRPPASALTSFYVTVSAGGALGGFLVSVAAPYLFSSYLEYPLVLIACWVFLLTICARDEKSRLCLLRSKTRTGNRTALSWLGVAVCCFLFLFCLRNAMVNQLSKSMISRRSFYGVLSIQPWSVDGQKCVQLVHGQISHGIQHLDPEMEDEPTLYYAKDTGLGMVMRLVDEAKKEKRIGMLGLGIGTVAAYCENDDSLRVYEINQDVIDIGTDPDVFTFWSRLEQRGAKGEIILGDARLSLEHELAEGKPQAFDVLVLDVFSGDAIPTHLLTLSAFETYLKHLASDGVIAVHISNRHLDLRPVVHSIADKLALRASFIATDQSEWMITGPDSVIQRLQQRDPQKVQVLAKPLVNRLWTDDYSNIFTVMK